MKRGRGGVARGGARTAGVALMRTQVGTRVPLSLKRLAKDYQELKDCKIPLVGVTAAPSEDDMKVWHANIRGPEGTPYKGGVFHVTINFPHDYPCSPPTVTLSTSITHPNVFGTSLCLDLLQKSSKGEWYQGWNSAYTVESILIQLQSFLFEKKVDALTPQQLEAHKKEVENANSFKCSGCRHRGSIEPFPQFNEREKIINDFVLIEDPHSLLEKEFVCYHTKAPLAETSLGIGVSLSRLPRTGEIRNVNPTLDLLSIKAFTKHKVRTSIAAERFTHWFPLFFGEKKPYEVKKQVFDNETQKYKTEVKTVDPYERFVHLLKSAFCFMTKGSTRKDFQPSMVLEVMPKLIITHMVEIVNESKHCSIIAIRRLINFYRIFTMLLEMCPTVREQINASLEQFILDPAKRVKDFAPSLGDLLAFIMVSDKYKMADLLNAYLEEQLDRQAFWIIRQIPELDHTDEANKGKLVVMEENRSEVCFKTGMTGFHMTLAFFELTKLFESRYDKKLVQFDEEIDKNFGCLPMEVENALQDKLKQIRKIDNFKKYYNSIGIDCPDDEALSLRLRQAITNSKSKRYHGSSEHMNVLPTMAEQASELLMKEPNAFAKYDEETKSFTAAAADPFWRKACHDRFPWTKRFDEQNYADQTPAMIAQEADKRAIDVFQTSDSLRSMINASQNDNFGLNEVKGALAYDEYAQGDFNWRQLYHKLCFEQMLQYFETTLDFKLFYKFIAVLGSEITVLRIPSIEKSALKSNNYWLMQVLGRMPQLHTVKFHKNNTSFMSADFFKFMAKGMAYMKKEGRELKKLSFTAMPLNTGDQFYSILKHHPNLISLDVNRETLRQNEAKYVGKILADYKFIRELNISDCSLDVNTSKEIADGLMRAKALEIFKCENNPSMGKTMDTILYNLAFSPKIKMINMSKCGTVSKDTAEALYKLLKISGAIEILLVRQTGISAYLSEEFFKGLAENKTLTYLSLDENGVLAAHQTSLLGKAIAINAYKNGSLQAVSIRNWIQNFTAAELLIENLQISDKDHELWFGDKKIADAMQKEQLDKKMHFKLKYFDIRGSHLVNLGNTFKPKNIEKQTNPSWPQFLSFVTQNKFSLNLNNCKMTKSSMELFAYAIGQNPVGECKITQLNLSQNTLDKEGCKLLNDALAHNKSIRFLDLSKCKMGVSGIKSLCQSLKTNDTIETLNLYRNIIDVDGARSLGEALKLNKKLNFLDIGHNRIRITGLKAIIDGVLANESSNLHSLGIRANFINDEGFTDLFDRLILSDGKHHLTHVFVEQNFLTEYHKIALHKEVVRKGVKVYVDEFEGISVLDKALLDRSIWLSPLPKTGMQNFEAQIEKFFSSQQECGFITDVRIRVGRKVPGRTRENCFAIVEYAHENSVPRSLKLASKRCVNFGGLGQRLFKAGTRTVVIRPSQRRR